MTTVYLNNSKWRLLDQCERGRIFLQLGQLYSSDRVCIEWTEPIEILVLFRGQTKKWSTQRYGTREGTEWKEIQTTHKSMLIKYVKHINWCFGWRFLIIISFSVNVYYNRHHSKQNWFAIILYRAKGFLRRILVFISSK